MRFTSEFSITPGSKKEAAELFKVLKPEAKSDSRVQSSLELDVDRISLIVKANDRSAMRSAVNSYGTWIRLYADIGGIK